MMSLFNERQARLYAAEKAMALGHGGITLVSEVLGLSERTIRRGIEELESGGLGEMPERARRPGAGRKASEEVDSSLVDDLELLMGETTAGDPWRRAEECRRFRAGGRPRSRSVSGAGKGLALFGTA
jgi:transposase